jgi:ATP phosphoribosyltransferase
MIRMALPKGRNLDPVVAAFVAAGIDLAAVADGSRLLWRSFPTAGASGLDVLLLKDRDLPLYVARGIADCGVVGRDLLDELEECGDLLVPLEFGGGASRLCLIGREGSALPAPGAQARLATKYPRTAARWLERQPWSAEILELSGSIELAPLLGLSDLILDIVQSGATLHAHGLVELATVREIRPCFVVHRGAWQSHRREIAALVRGLEEVEVAS